MSTGTDIGAFLKSKGSPLADHVPDILASANRYRIDPRLLVAIAGGETSFGKAGRGPSVYNAWGIGPGKSYASWQDGIDQAAKLLRQNYIGKGLTSLAAIQRKWAPVQASNDPKNLNSNWLRVNGGFYSELGGNPQNVTLGWRTGSAPGVGIPLPKVQQVKAGDVERVAAFDSVMADTAFHNLGRIAQGGKADTSLSGFVSSLGKAQEAYNAVPATKIATAVPTSAGKVSTKGASYKLPSVKKGLLIAPTQWQPTHVTDGLGWGTKSAVDIMARAGTAVGAPESGKIIKWGSAQGGEALYFEGDSGTEYWMGHIDDRLPVGTQVKKGTPIAVISSHHKTPHLHIDKR